MTKTRGEFRHVVRRPGVAACAIVASISSIILAATGCQESLNPLSDEIYLEREFPESTLREVEPIDFHDYERSEDAESDANGPNTTMNGADGTATLEAEPEWWERFEYDSPPDELPLTIEQCRALALEYNLDLQVVLVDPTISREAITEAEAQFEALFFADAGLSKSDSPTATTLSGSQTENINLSAGVRVPLRTGGNITVNLPTNRFETDNQFSTLNPSITTDMSVSLSQPLLRNAGVKTNTYSIRVAHYNRQQSEATVKLQVIRVLSTLDRVYWTLYASRQALKVRKDEYDLAVAQFERAQRLVDQGEAAEVELIRAESGVSERLESIIIAENAVRDSERNLKRVLNIPGLDMNTPVALVPATEPNPMQYSLNADSLASAALDQRMEMINLELDLLTNQSTIDLRRNQVLPIVNLDYTYNMNGLGGSYSDAFDMLNDRDFEDHRLSMRVEVPLGNEAAMSRVRQALGSRMRTLATRDQQIATIRQEVFNAVDQLEANWQRILASRQAAVLAARTLAAEQRQFDLGLRTSTDVLDAQTRLANAQLAEIRALTEYEIAQIDIAVAVGMTLGADRVRWEPTPIADS